MKSLGKITIFTVLIALLAVLLLISGMRALAAITPPAAPVTAEATEAPDVTPLTVRIDVFRAVVATPSPLPAQTPAPGRYDGITMTADELHELAAVVALEAGAEELEGQQAVAEVIFNRVISPAFPDSVHDVLHQRGQFSTIDYLSLATITDEQYAAIEAALSGPQLLPEDVVYFSRGAENDRVWGSIGNHVFCRQYVWG